MLSSFGAVVQLINLIIYIVERIVQLSVLVGIVAQLLVCELTGGMSVERTACRHQVIEVTALAVVEREVQERSLAHRLCPYETCLVEARVGLVAVGV